MLNVLHFHSVIMVCVLFLCNVAIERNLQIFDEMKKGTPNGLQYCLRAKIDYKSDNGCLRDPVMYRCRPEEHVAHGNKYMYVLPSYSIK